MEGALGPTVVGVAKDDRHRFSKAPHEQITLVAGLGVEGDAHAGATVQHRSRVARNPAEPNLRQVHLIPEQFLDEARSRGFDVGPGDMGENVLTAGVDLLALPLGARLRLGHDAIVRVTGLRNPCVQIDRFRRGLLALAAAREETGEVVRKAGVMGVVEQGGVVRPGDPIRIDLPAGPHLRLQVV